MTSSSTFRISHLQVNLTASIHPHNTLNAFLALTRPLLVLTTSGWQSYCLHWHFHGLFYTIIVSAVILRSSTSTLTASKNIHLQYWHSQFLYNQSHGLYKQSPGLYVHTEGLYCTLYTTGTLFSVRALLETLQYNLHSRLLSWHVLS